MARFAPSVAFVGVLVLVGGLLGRAQSPETAYKPFTAEFVETATNAKGERRIASHQTIAVNRDGTRVLKLGLHDGQRHVSSPTGLNVTASDTHKSTTKSSAPPLRRFEASLCSSDAPEESVGERIIFGYRALGKLRRSSDRTNEAWYAVDYDCAMVETILTFSTGEKSLLQLRAFRESAEAGLFDTANLIEGPPSKLSDPAECLRREACRERMERVDAGYYENRRRNGLAPQN